MEYLDSHEDLQLYDIYVDDGYTGTNFDRPAFVRLHSDIESKKVQCVVVKDLSRLGRNMSMVSDLINDFFPSNKIRFVSVTDGICREYYDVDTSQDMVIDLKNMFNGFYPKDISKKVRSTFKTKQAKGQFIGAFASYGYTKSEDDHNKLEIDEYAASVVKRIFALYLSGMGQNTIAKTLNEEGVLCPSEYKKQIGLNYHNSNRLDGTSYWTYSTIRRVLQNEFYIGNTVQNKNFRQLCKKKAVSMPREQWIVVENTHEPIIDRDTWERVQDLLKRNTRQTELNQNIHMFAGFLKCGDCGRAMVKIRRKGVVTFNCGSYNRYGRKYCSIHSITEDELESIILDDLNTIIHSVHDLEKLIEEEQAEKRAEAIRSLGDVSQSQTEIQRLKKKQEQAYEDYSDGIISREDYLKYKEKYERQAAAIQSKIDVVNQMLDDQSVAISPWIEKLLAGEPLDHLDRQTVVELISMIYIYEDKTIRIVYNFSEELDVLLNHSDKIQSDVTKPRG
jgi:DNA invertase Pin-like site-specific DNA recombinase